MDRLYVMIQAMEHIDEQVKGLTQQEVNQRIQEGKVNRSSDDELTSEKDIIHQNVFTFFNLMYFVIFLFVLSVGSWRNIFFITAAICNTAIGIYQQIKAKRMLDKMKVLTMTQVLTMRDGKEVKIPIDQLVVDDVVILERGNQIPSDGVVLDGLIEVNESLLTGESDSLEKKEGDSVYSGSYITAGKAYVKIQKVGKENYISSIMKTGKAMKKAPSELRQSLDKVLRVISIIIIPLGVLLFARQLIVNQMAYSEVVLSVASALLGMIPSGLMLLTSVALALSSVRLANQKALVQEPYAIESLARMDVLCLDKTGTLTEGNLNVVEVIPFVELDRVKEIIGNILSHVQDANATNDALSRYFEKKENYTFKELVPFSSAKKYGVYTFEEGTFYMGAIEFIQPDVSQTYRDMVKERSSLGYRMLAIVEDRKEVLGFVAISDTVRPTAKNTVKHLEKSGIQIKIISGDDPVTASALAIRAGVKNANKYCDMSKIKSKRQLLKIIDTCAVFGRVTPDQKADLIDVLKETGHHPAMVGDGVNDIPAIKAADCGMAMVAGSDASRHAADIVLLNNSFDVLPSIIKEGCRVINNITLSSSMYLVKTIFSVLLTVFSLLFQLQYPFEPIQLTLISTMMVGIPTLLLTTFEPNYNQVNTRYFETVLGNALPGAICIAILSIVVMVLGGLGELSEEACVTIVFILTAFNYSITLLHTYSPITPYRLLINGTLLVGFVVLSFLLHKFLNFTFDWHSSQSWFLVGMGMLLSYYFQKYFRKGYNALIHGKQHFIGVQ